MRRNGRQFAEIREERRDTFTTDDVDDYRRELLASDLSPRTAQKILVLLHGVFKLAKRRKLIAANPSEDAERITLEDPGIFNILEPVEFEAVYRAVLGEPDERGAARRADEIDKLTTPSASSTARCSRPAFYAGPRLGELRDLPWRNVDFAGSMIRVESGFTQRQPLDAEGQARPLDADGPDPRSAAGRALDPRRFTGAADYVFSTELGERVRRRPRPQGVLRRPRARRPRPSARRGRPARQPAGADPRPRPSALVVHLGGQRLAAHEGAGLRRPPRHQDDAALRAPPDEGAGRRSRRRLPRPGARRRRQSSNAATRPTARGARSRR